MASETDCSSSSTSSDLEIKRKLQKKLKKKSDKKSKKHKKEKKKKKNKMRKLSSTETISLSKEKLEIHKPHIQYRTELGAEYDGNKDIFGPALPPYLQNKVDKSENSLVIGPILPKEFAESTKVLGLKTEKVCKDEIKSAITLESDDDAMQGTYGPLPVSNERAMSATQIELEQRALELKMSAIEGIPTTVGEQNLREKWMLELPDVGLKGGLSALSNLKRGFHQGKEKPDFRDRSAWTKTPDTEKGKQNLVPSKISKEQLEQQAQAVYEKQRDAEQDAIAKKLKKKHKREQSLVEMHQKKLRREDRKKAKEIKDNESKPERRPFTRDIDLKLTKIDRNQTKQIVDKAKILNTKFSSGQSKYL